MIESARRDKGGYGITVQNKSTSDKRSVRKGIKPEPKAKSQSTRMRKEKEGVDHRSTGVERAQ